jgi:hypothetical protein
VIDPAKRLDLRVRATLLPHKIVTWKTKHNEPLLSVFFMKRLKRVVLLRESAFRRGVYDEHHLASMLANIKLRP